MQVNGALPQSLAVCAVQPADGPSTINGQTFLISVNAKCRNVPGNSVMHDVALKCGGLPADGNGFTGRINHVFSTHGVHLDKPYTYSFTTRPDTDKSPIYVKSVTPIDPDVCEHDRPSRSAKAADASTLTATNLGITGPDNVRPFRRRSAMTLRSLRSRSLRKAPLSSGTPANGEERRRRSRSGHDDHVWMEFLDGLRSRRNGRRRVDAVYGTTLRSGRFRWASGASIRRGMWLCN